MSLTIISSVSIAVLGVIISCLLSYITAKKEVEKKIIEIRNENQKSVFLSFAELQEAVRVFCSNPTIGIYQKNALKAVGNYIIYSDKTTQPLCESLSRAINACNAITAEDILCRLSEIWNKNKPEILTQTKRSHKQK